MTLQEHARARPPRPRILIADDDDDIRSVFEIVLADNYDIRCAANAAEALLLAESWTPDVVLLDWTLPDSSGEEVVARLRSINESFADLPIVVVSGAPGVRALAASVNAVPCPKPCDVDQLMSAIEGALASAHR
jgi:CheY-like chemotaxis protein